MISYMLIVNRLGIFDMGMLDGKVALVQAQVAALGKHALLLAKELSSRKDLVERDGSGGGSAMADQVVKNPRPRQECCSQLWKCYQ